MKSVEELKVVVVDFGSFESLAEKLSETCSEVSYHAPIDREFRSIDDAVIGMGIPKVHRIESFMHPDTVKETDLYVFPDIGYEGEQLYLRSIGKPVWGSNGSDELERLRTKFNKLVKDVGLPVVKSENIRGLDNLVEYLKDRKNKWVKVNEFRNEVETFHFRNWAVDETMLDVLAVRFGPAKDRVPFLVFEKIESEMEMGGDTYIVDGQWPDTMLHGTEAKDKAYFSAVTRRDKMPKQLQDVLDAFGPVLAPYRSRQQFSMEVRRVSDDEAYFIDPTIRGGLPSTSSQLENMTNFAEVIYAGAHGVLVQPKYKDPKFATSGTLILTTKSDKTAWAVAEVPKKLKSAMKLVNCCQIGKRICFPHDDSSGTTAVWSLAWATP